MKKKKIKYSGEIDLVGFKIPCFVLEDGTRILSGRGMQDTLKMVDEVDSSKEQQAGNRLQQILNQKAVKPFIDKEKKLEKNPDHFAPIVCYKGEQKINGYEATTLVDICKIFLKVRKDAREKGYSLSSSLEAAASQSEILLGAFAKVGIIALVDEATGYQYEREEFELQKVLKAYVSESVLKWRKTFQLSFYKELFRLKDIPFTAENIRWKPRFIATLTNELVYKKLPEGVLEELKKRTPKTQGGNYKHRFHQLLTFRIGREALKKQIHTVEALASVSKDWNYFSRLMKQKFHSQEELPFIDAEAMDDKEKETKFDKTLEALSKVPSTKKE